jgi:hypothetical protein
VLPTDVIHDAPRVVLYTEKEAKEARENDVDLLEEAREITLSRTAVYQQNLRCYHAQKVNRRIPGGRSSTLAKARHRGLA